MMHKVCPNCKASAEVTEISFPLTRCVKMKMLPQRIESKLSLDTYTADIAEEWCEYANKTHVADYYCVNCDYQYTDAYTWDDVWEQMVWRKK